MRKLFLISLLLGGYIWMKSSGNEEIVIEKCKLVYKMVINWFEDIDVDYHIQQKNPSRRKQDHPRRWS